MFILMTVIANFNSNEGYGIVILMRLVPLLY